MMLFVASKRTPISRTVAADVGSVMVSFEPVCIYTLSPTLPDSVSLTLMTPSRSILEPVVLSDVHMAIVLFDAVALSFETTVQPPLPR